MQKNQTAEIENYVSCINCRQILFSCGFIGWAKIKCSKCNEWLNIGFDEKGVLSMAREPPANLQIARK